MRVLLSTIGSRADVQPVVALTLQLRELGQEVRVCAPPTSVMDRRPRDPLRSHRTRVAPYSETQPISYAGPPSPEQRRQMVEGGVTDQFETIPAPAEGCDVIVAATALQIAARSVAEQRGIGCVYASQLQPDSPGPPPHHPPPVLAMLGEAPADERSTTVCSGLADAERLNDI
jgi:vancomycin aglycone glucosyltransferase